MKIIETDWKWSGSLTKRPRSDYIALHHSAGLGSAASVHKSHQNRGWAGIGYHFYITRNGEIYRGRPIDKMGAHITNHNYDSVGVCFEGNYHQSGAEMPRAQLLSGREVIAYLKGLYPNARLARHRDLGATACPGDYFPFDELTKGENDMTLDEAKKILTERANLSESTITFLLCYKYGEDLILKLAKAM